MIPCVLGTLCVSYIDFSLPFLFSSKMTFEKVERYAGEASQQVKKVGEAARDAWRHTQEPEPQPISRTREEPYLGLSALAGLLGGAGAAIVFSNYHETLNAAAPEAAVLGTLLLSGTGASVIASACAANEVPPHFCFLGTAAGLAGVFMSLNRYLEIKRELKQVEKLPSQTLGVTAVALAAVAVGTAYWMSPVDAIKA